MIGKFNRGTVGPLTGETAAAAFAEQAQALQDGGVDLVVLETFFALDEALWAIGGNCGRSLQDNAAVVAEFLACTSRPL